MSVNQAVSIGADQKWQSLQKILAPLVTEGVLVAFSGGVDSAFLLWAAMQAAQNTGGRVVAFTTRSDSLPKKDKDDATIFAKEIGAVHIWQESHELNNPLYSKNDALRCYHCKNELFERARKTAAAHNLKHILYGYSASDHGDTRPGHRAALERGILFPLETTGYEKDEIRTRMKAAGFDLADKPASPCLSSRIANGILVTTERLADIAALEGMLRQAGIRVFRVRIARSEKGYFIRIETAPEEMAAVLNIRQSLCVEGVCRGYKWITLDLGGYHTGGANR